MGGPVLKEGPGEGEQPQRAAVQNAENILRSVPQKTSVPGPVENAEKLMRELMAQARQIDAMFGRSAAGEMADISREIGRMRAQLGVIGAEQVAGVNERYRGQAQRIDQELSRVELNLGGRPLSESREAFNRARAGVEVLSETIAAARGLFSAGAPQELLNASDRALELYNAGQEGRARLLLKAASTFIADREFFTSAAGREGSASLVGFVRTISDEALVVDEGRAEKALETFRQAMSYPPEQRADDREYAARSAQFLGAATAAKLSETLGAWLAQGAQGNVEGAKTLAGMVRTYVGLAQAGKGAAGLETVKAALVRYADTGDAEAAARFREAAMGLAVTNDLVKLRSAITSWGQGPYRNVAREALENTNGMLQEKRYSEAAAMLAYTAMYADSVRVLGLEKASRLPRQGDALAGSFSTMAKALGALGRGQPAVDGVDAVALFAEGHDAAIHIGLKRNHEELVQKFEGKAPWAAGMEPGLIPLGARRADGTYPGSLEVGRLREYEKKSGDAALKGGQTLDQLLASCGRAAQSGDAEAYRKSVEAFAKRFSLVSSGYFMGQLAEGAEQMAGALDSIKKSYRGGAPADAVSRLDRLGEGLRQFSAELRSGAKPDEAIPRTAYETLRNAFNREQALATMANQAWQNGGYASMAKGITGSMAGVTLRETTVHFNNAAKALLKCGDAKTQDEYEAAVADAREEYEAAMMGRQAALAVFSAAGKEKKMFGGARAETMNASLKMFDGWRELQMDILDGVLEGKDTKKLQERAGLVEISVFALPEKERDFVDFSGMQKNVRELALAGKTAEAEAEWGRMQKTLEKQKLWTNVAKTVAGLATIPVPIVSGAIFASMAANQAIDEAAEAGRVSGMTWAMLGISIATWGIGGVAGELRTASELAKAAGRARAATAYGRAATGVTVAGLGAGVGMGVMTVPATMRAVEEGKYGEAAFNIAMVLFPFAHMGGTYVRGRITAARVRAAGDFKNDAEGLAHGAKAVPPGVREGPVAPGAAMAGQRTGGPAQGIRLRQGGLRQEESGLHELEPEPAPQERPVARRTEQQVYDDYTRAEGGGILPSNITPSEWAYVRARQAGATHEEAMLALAGKARPTAAERIRQLREAHARARRVGEADIPHAMRECFDAAIAEIGAGHDWLEGGETVAGQTASTGRVLRSIERQVIALVEGGQEVDVIVISGDKARLGQINQLMGPGYGDRALAAYRELFACSVRDATGDQGIAFMIRPNPGSDEAIGILIVNGGRGKEVRAKLAAAIEAQTPKVFGEYADPAHPRSLAAVRNMARNELDLVAEVVDVGQPVSVRQGREGRAVATNADGSDAMVTHEVPTASGTETTTEFMPKLVRTAEEQGSASHAPRMRELLNSGVDSDMHKAQNVSNVTETERVSGMAFEIRLEITDPAVLAEARALLPKTRKGLHGTLKNETDISWLNTFLGHYGANRVVNVVEEAVGEYAAAASLTIRRLGTMKYVLEDGTHEQMVALDRHVSSALQKAGMKLRVSGNEGQTAVLSDAMAAEALARISNGHLDLDWSAAAYRDANALISAMAIGNDATLLRLLGVDYGAMRGLVEFVRRNPAIRNVEDLFIALHDPTLGGSGGPAMREAFSAFITMKGVEFRGRLETLAPPVRTMKEEMVLGIAIGAEGEVLQTVTGGGRRGAPPSRIPLERARSGERLEKTIGAKPRGPELEENIRVELMTKSETKDVAAGAEAIARGESVENAPNGYRRLAAARVLDAALAGEIKEPLPEEYARAIMEIESEGKDLSVASAAPERAMLAAKYATEVLYNKGLIPLERELAAERITGDVADDAKLFLKLRKGMDVSDEEHGGLIWERLDAVEQRMRDGMSEAKAVISVAKEVNAAYQKASAELERAITTGRLGAEPAAQARRILRFMHGRRMGMSETSMIGEAQLNSVDMKMGREGKSQAKAIIETITEANQQELKAARYEAAFSNLVGFNKEDIKPLVSLIAGYEKQGYTFAGPMGSRVSFRSRGDYDLVFIGPRSQIPEPRVVQDKVGPRNTQVEAILVPEDLKTTETTYIQSQPIAYPLLMNFLAMNESAVQLMGRLRSVVQPAEVTEWYIELSNSVLNIDGHTRDDLWASTAANGVMQRYDLDVLNGNPAMTQIAATAFRRCCLDFFPRAIYAMEFNEFPATAIAENTTVYENLFRGIQGSNPELAQPLRQMHDIGINVLNSRLINLNSVEDIRAAVAQVTGKPPGDVTMADLEALCPADLDAGAIGRIRTFLSGKNLSKSTFKEFRVLVLKELRDRVGSLMKETLEKLKK